MRQTDQQFEEVMFGRFEGRIAMTLVRLAHGTSSSNDGVVALRITQKELAGMVGAARESLNKQLHVWQKEGALKLGKRLIEIANVEALETLS